MNKIADEYIVIPRGPEAVSFSATLVFNESGAFLWKTLNNYCSIDSLTELLAEKYSIDLEAARADVTDYINKMKENGLLEENSEL